MKVKLSMFLSIIIILVSVLGLPAFANNYDGYESNGGNSFIDVNENHWAYDAIEWMAAKKILDGYGEGIFKPDGTITRAQFAKIMVLALDLSVDKPESSSFIDIGENQWFYEYVESAKYYLTGFKTSRGDYFKPGESAVREDMAVALVKALGMEDEDYDESILDKFGDEDRISKNLRKYVAIAVKNKIMQGYTVDGGEWEFGPGSYLTRAQAAVLLYNTIKENEEKVTYDDEGTAPSVTGIIDGDKIVLNWTKAQEDGFQYYKVVASKYNSKPQYPDDGYLFSIAHRGITSAVIKVTDVYDGGDFNNRFLKGEKYYFSVTTVYDGLKVPGSAVQLAFSGEGEDVEESYITPRVEVNEVDGKIKVEWNKIAHSKFQGYKVVVSKYNSSPKYPDDGYFKWITDKDQTYTYIKDGDSYNNGDFGGIIKGGEPYYISITAVYNDRKVAGNTIRIEVPE